MSITTPVVNSEISIYNIPKMTKSMFNLSAHLGNALTVGYSDR